MRKRIATALGALILSLTAGCATQGDIGRLAPVANRSHVGGLEPTCCNFGWGGSWKEFNFFLFGFAGGDKATFVLTAIPGVPACVAGGAAGLPFSAATLSGWPVAGGAIVGDLLATPVIFPFWLIGRAIDSVTP